MKREDVVIAITGASAALAGLVLVFLGVLVTTYQSLVGDASVAVLSRFKRASLLTLGVFLGSLASVTMSTSWLAAHGGACFYTATLVVFFLQLAALAALAVYATADVLLRG